jgi:putative membrane protein
MMGWGWMPFFGLFPLAFLVAVIVGIFLLVRSTERNRGFIQPRQSSGLDVLDERYAKGEIEREDYLQKKRDIGGDGAQRPSANP